MIHLRGFQAGVRPEEQTGPHDYSRATERLRVTSFHTSFKGRRGRRTLISSLAAGLVAAALLLAAPGIAQQHQEMPPPPPPATLPGGPDHGDSPVSTQVVPEQHQAGRESHSGTAEPGPGGSHAPEGGVHEQGEAHAEAGAHDAAESHGEAGHSEGGEHEEGVSIHLPTVLYRGLLHLWTLGPATLTAEGALDSAGQPVNPADLAGARVAGFDFHPHGSSARFRISPVVGAIGTKTSAAGAATQAATVGGRQITFIQPEVKLTLEGMFPEALVVSLITLLVMIGVMIWLVSDLKVIPNRKQAFTETVYEFLDSNIGELIGPGYRRYMPLVVAAFLYILIMNLAGIIPGWTSPTANINVAAGMALVVFLYVQYEGIRVNGLGGYLKHFWGEPAWMGPLNVVIHGIGELARLLSLSIRLFGNIFGEDVVIIILMYLAALFTAGWVPFQAPMLLLAMFTSLVQAAVFAILTCVYLALATQHDDHGEHHDSHGSDHSSSHTPVHPAGASA